MTLQHAADMLCHSCPRGLYVVRVDIRQLIFKPQQLLECGGQSANSVSLTEFKDVSAQCSDGWTRHRGRCFKFFADAKPWAHAEVNSVTNILY